MMKINVLHLLYVLKEHGLHLHAGRNYCFMNYLKFKKFLF